MPSDASLRVAFLINAPIVGGAERHTLDLAEGLTRSGCHCTLFAMRGGDLKPPNGVDWRVPALGEPYSLLHRTKEFAQMLLKTRPHVIFAVNERPVLIGFLARLLSGAKIPIVAITHSTLLRTRKEKLLQLIYLPLFNRADAVIFVSENQRLLWRARGLRAREEKVILNGIDMNRFSLEEREARRQATRAALSLRASDFVVGACAVFRPEKNLVQIVEAVANVRKLGVPARALLVGEGPTRPDIERAAEELGVREHILFAGAQKDVRPYLASFDVGVLSSTTETLSLAALEMLASGAPMLMSDIGGAREIVDGKNGDVFPVGDTDALVERLSRLWNSRAEGPSPAEVRASVVNKFDKAKMVREYFDYLAKFGPPPSLCDGVTAAQR
ncbi:MAG: glycosyltransferase [Methylocystis sp.]